ncbi:splicing factor 3B [Schizosaccharomyces japonicus yFS275]|uniref:Splicing factor subunit n=1 Tax=Schizosaccharomyces japonicus (strain yFS275 / FY16936) TaxID=402676 RepID=B6JWT1_SCHJY|nr:splicing factor 3B [Schizosaccharomyces japonicus yFS275]EEB05832.1 splicing factor 3B [Schizosaccharomyces japonicus yFS275]
MADRLRSQAKLEQLQARFVGVGYDETTKYEWLSNQHRDTLSSMVGHPTNLAYLSTAMGESRLETRTKLLEKMVLPCGPPPPADE